MKKQTIGGSVLGLVLFMMLSVVSRAQTDVVADLNKTIPEVQWRTLVAIAGSTAKAFSWKWASLPPTSLDEKTAEAMQNDLKRLQTENAAWNRFHLPAHIDSIYINPTNHLHYVVMIPKGAEAGSFDLNVVYVYDPKSKWVIFRTYADPSS